MKLQIFQLKYNEKVKINEINSIVRFAVGFEKRVFILENRRGLIHHQPALYVLNLNVL